MLISAYSANSIHAYEIDRNGDPILPTRRVFITGLTGAEGAAIDPLTGDFLFSTFGLHNQLIAVGGFVVPPVPLPPSAILGASAVMLLITRFRLRLWCEPPWRAAQRRTGRCACTAAGRLTRNFPFLI